MSKENPTLAETLFSAMLNASLIAFQGPNMIQDPAAMKAVGESIAALDKALDKWFAEQAGFEMSAADRAAISKPVKRVPVAPVQAEKTTASGIVVVETPPVPSDFKVAVGRDGQPTQEVRDGKLYWIKSGTEVSATPVSTGAVGNDTTRPISRGTAQDNPFDVKPLKRVRATGDAKLEGADADLAAQMAQFQAEMQGH